jgi:predicted MFS family arabinose efflux permease
MSTSIRSEAPGLRAAPAWGAVLALSLCVATLIASEFMPVSLLTPIAAELSLTDGQAGQAIGVSGIFAVLTSLFIAAATPGLDRRTLLLALTALMLVSGLVVAFAPNYEVLMLGRALIGIAIGGFWSMSAATIMRLVPAKDVPKGLAILNGGNALATTVAAPLGSFMGEVVGWRGAFFSVVPLAAVTLVWLLVALPRMPNRSKASPLATFRVLRRPEVSLGMAAAGLFFMGQFALFTYLRPFLEKVTAVETSTLSLLLLLLGVAGLLGTVAVGTVLRSSLYGALTAMSLAMAALALGLVEFGTSLPATAVILALWGFVGTAAPVGWWAWLSQALPDDAEAGGGLMVAVVQFAITAGATSGGWLFDAGGHGAAFTFAAFLLATCAVASHALGRRAKTHERRTSERSPDAPMGSPHAGEPSQSPTAKEAMPC